jgi:hypothetical protein
MEFWVEQLRNGVDRSRLLWSPEAPNLIEVTVSLLDGNGARLDTVGSYVGIRSVATRDGHFLLNGSPYFLRMVLEQGIWPESHLAAPSMAALRHEVELVKQLGFNGVRVHQKIEDPRFLALCDRLGLLVWEEMPSCYAFSATSVRRLVHEWTEVIVRDRSHPCVVCWVPLNESWGVPDLLSRPDQRSLALALVHLTRALDGSRPVISNDGWEHLDSDILTIHDYSGEPEVLHERYGTTEALDKALRNAWPGPHRLLINGGGPSGQPVMVTEFGGLSLPPDPSEDWPGYTIMGSTEELTTRFTELVAALLACHDLAGFCYTQLTDTFQERNGLLMADRSPKIPFEIVRAALDAAPRSLAAVARRADRKPTSSPPLGPAGQDSRWEVRRRPALSTNEDSLPPTSQEFAAPKAPELQAHGGDNASP